MNLFLKSTIVSVYGNRTFYDFNANYPTGKTFAQWMKSIRKSIPVYRNAQAPALFIIHINQLQTVFDYCVTNHKISIIIKYQSISIITNDLEKLLN